MKNEGKVYIGVVDWIQSKLSQDVSSIEVGYCPIFKRYTIKLANKISKYDRSTEYKVMSRALPFASVLFYSRESQSWIDVPGLSILDKFKIRRWMQKHVDHKREKVIKEMQSSRWVNLK